MRQSRSFATHGIPSPANMFPQDVNLMQRNDQLFGGFPLKSIYDPRKFCTLPKQPRGGVSFAHV
jgi:hypothetical protein